MKNLEDETEPVHESTETFMQLSCFLATETRYLQSGILNSLTEEVEKNSEKLSRNCKYQKETKISRLPANLIIQMVRFFYKEREQVNAKILKDVKFPAILDVFDFCTPELQQKLLPQREAHKLYDDKMMERKRMQKLEGTKDEDEVEHKNFLPTSFEDDPGSNNSGFYELKAIITHKGRASNSGHYIAWVRVKGKTWACCDDDTVHSVAEEDVLKLSGGGDSHLAYILIYGARPTPVVD
ncbi:Ubiquitin carboxyl-terminal hydrolase [Aphelenchoides bicaudatus]|nr:Ubiquitin carboxyl-terminal hydrolase [Aphelenchoides bicaudatus]